MLESLQPVARLRDAPAQGITGTGTIGVGIIGIGCARPRKTVDAAAAAVRIP